MMEKIPADIKYKLTNKKNGKLTKILDSVVEDFRFLTTQSNSKYLLQNYKIFQQLGTLNAILENFLSNTYLPKNRISATVKKGTKQRVFRLQKINYSGTKDIALIRGEEYFRGLKKNERNFLSSYMRKKGSDFPLQEEKLYTWMEVKNLLSRELKKSPVQPDELKLIVRERMKTARKIIEKSVNVSELRKKTGCNFQVIYEGEPKDIKKV